MISFTISSYLNRIITTLVITTPSCHLHATDLFRLRDGVELNDNIMDAARSAMCSHDKTDTLATFSVLLWDNAIDGCILTAEIQGAERFELARCRDHLWNELFVDTIQIRHWCKTPLPNHITVETQSAAFCGSLTPLVRSWAFKRSCCRTTNSKITMTIAACLCYWRPRVGWRTDHG
jgi:hypothetical protein